MTGKQNLLGVIARRKKLFGVGINDADYVVRGKTWTCLYFQRWKGMLSRCYGKAKTKNDIAYKDCYVCEEWLTFSNFKKWMEQQNWQGKQLDKDILVPGNKEYGPNTCIFVSQELNHILICQMSKKSSTPSGVVLNGNRYEVQIARHGKGRYIGSFETVEEASRVYKKLKYEYLLEWANNLTSEDTSDIKRTKEGLIRHSGLLLG